MIARGNHKSARTDLHSKILREAYEKEVSHGWQIPTTVECSKKLRNVLIIPLVVACQMAVNAEGNYVDKYRVTHNCSFNYSFGFSLNSAVDMESIPDCRYGKALLRYLHQIHVARLKHPNVKIYQVKTDLDAAYRRIHVMPSIAKLQISVINKIAYIGSRLPFGSSPVPFLYSIISDVIFDLNNDILEEPDWNYNELHSPNTHKFSHKVIMDKDIPFGQAKTLLPPVPFRQCFVDGYIDDGMAACLDLHDNVTRLQHAVPLAVHTIFRPLGEEILPRKDPLSDKKLQGEDAPSEQNIVLGWDINTRTFRVQLPVHKNIARNKDIATIIKNRSTNFDEIKSILGRLTREVTIFFPGRFFLNRIRNLERRCIKFGTQNISSEENKDFQLWTIFLDNITTAGVSINNVIFTSYDIICWPDASEHGLGGYTSSGLAFSYEIPTKYKGIFHINLLEFLAAHWTIHMAISNSPTTYCRIVHLADNISALA